MPDNRRIAVLTTGRQDYGILRSTIHLLAESEGLEPLVWAGGMHLQPRFGKTVGQLPADGVRVARELPFVGEPPDPLGDAARAVDAVGAALRQDRPDALLLAGDRTETLAAALAATIERVPLVHLHGGEETEGAVDNACRHAITKLSHLHLVSHPAHAARVIQMGEDPASVVVVGAPGIDNLYRADLPTRAELAATVGHPLPDPLVLVTLHPVTLGGDPLEEAGTLSAAMDSVPATYLVTLPNADAGGAAIREHWERWSRGRADAVVVEALGERRYWAALREASLVLGNSSSGIIEAPAAGVPVVNVGDRQKGRLRCGRVLDVPARAEAIAEAVRQSLAGGRGGAGDGDYPEGLAAPRVVEAIRRWSPPALLRKPFVETLLAGAGA